MTKKSIIIDTDSYKVSMWKQYPEGTQYVYSYIESRGGLYKETLILGIQAYIREVLSKPISQEDIDYGEMFWNMHGEPFNKEGWQYILEKHNGILPVEIKSIDEGSIVPVYNVIATVVNTDPMVPWITTWIETSLLRAIWYPTTVATQSWQIKKVIKSFLIMSGDEKSLEFKLHDFGSRGVSSYETAYLGSMAHLVNFKGTDTAIGILAANEYYDADINQTAFSIPASEHSIATSYGRENEKQYVLNMLNKFSQPGTSFAMVSDSYNINKFCDLICTDEEIREKIIAHGKTGGFTIIRPDSGDPTIIIPDLLRKLEKSFGTTINDKGFKVLNYVRIIWGDGITELNIRTILTKCVVMLRYSADNIVFGMGGALLQMLNRDTQQFAMKCSAIYKDGQWLEVFKDPFTDKKKKSQKGRFMVINDNNLFKTIKYDEARKNEDLLKTRFKNGEILNQITFNELRNKSNK